MVRCAPVLMEECLESGKKPNRSVHQESSRRRQENKGVEAMHFVLVDDIRSHHDILKTRLEQACLQIGVPCEIGLTCETWQAAEAYAPQAPESTVWFLDIELKDEINGIELCRRIREKNRRAYIIYVSAYQQYALECCQSHAFDFLLKPWTDAQLLSCLKAVLKDQQESGTGHFLEARLGTRTIRLKEERIAYFMKDGMNMTAHYPNGRTFMWRESLDDLMTRLTPGMFAQCHRNCIVNLNHIREFRWSEEQLVLESGETLPVSRRRVKELKEMTGSGRR